MRNPHLFRRPRILYLSDGAQVEVEYAGRTAKGFRYQRTFRHPSGMVVFRSSDLEIQERDFVRALLAATVWYRELAEGKADASTLEWRVLGPYRKKLKAGERDMRAMLGGPFPKEFRQF